MRFQPASYLTFCLSVPVVLSVAQGIDGRSAPCATVEAAAQKVESIPIPGTKAFPESITSTFDGALFVGRLRDGGIARVYPRSAESTVFVRPGASGSRSILGVFADEASSTLWACSNDLGALGGPATGNDTGSALKGFDLKTGGGKRSVSLPGSHAFCNDITVDAKGSVYITDSANPTILKLSPGATTFEVFARDSAFSPPQGGFGLDAFAFGSNGNLYVTTYTVGESRMEGLGASLRSPVPIT
jgi:streptogramin lyase